MTATKNVFNYFFDSVVDGVFASVRQGTNIGNGLVVGLHSPLERFNSLKSNNGRRQGHVKSITGRQLLQNNSNGEGPASWTASFEKLLECPIGLHTFAEFLKKEFSAENIFFWTTCERFKLMPPGGEKKAEAVRIFQRHICIGSSEAVNVDSQARLFAEQSVGNAANNTFDLAQKQVFNLMKYDCYPRFLKSDLYKQSLSGSIECPELDTRLLIQPPATATPSKLKKSLSNAEDRRRKSLLPWHKKNRSKSKDRDDTEMHAEYISKSRHLNEEHGSKTSLDFSSSTHQEAMGRQPLCRVNLHSGCTGGTTVAQIRESETIQQLVDRLLQKRGLTFYCYDVTTDKNSKPLDIQSSSQLLVGCEVFVERKVTFKLDLPNRKIISVKSKHTKIISDVLKHILFKYDFLLSDVNIFIDGKIVDIEQPVTSIENYRLQVMLKEPPAKPPIQQQTIKISNVNNCKTLDEITNKVYKDILQGKSEASCVKSKSDRSSVKSEDWGSDHSSGIFGRFLRRDSGMMDKKKKLFIRNKVPSATSSIDDVNNEGAAGNAKKPLIAKWRPGVKLQVACSESDELYEGLSRAVRSRLEDQRGTEINFELPDFLKDKENSKLISSNMKKDRYSDEKCIENSKFYATSIGDKLNSKIVNVKQEYENHVINKESKNSNFYPQGNDLQPLRDVQDGVPSSEGSCSSNQSTPTRNNLEITVIERVDSNQSALSYNKVSEPPPLPPKPKIVPIKPSNWGQNDFNKNSKDGLVRKSERNEELFLEQPTSSFV